MPKTVRILGMAPNLMELLPSDDAEIWPSNAHKGYYKYIPWLINESKWTRWFNLHSRAHMDATYPKSVEWWKSLDGTKPIYTQKLQPDFPGCVEFPGPQIIKHFNTKYFTCSVCWLIAFAIMEGFNRIELWGFQLSDRKPNGAYAWERPCFFYWVQRARDNGIEVWYQPEIEALPFEPGDPTTYSGPLYGYETKGEKDVPEWLTLLRSKS